MPDGAHYGNGTGALPDGVDIRSWGGYIVLPPSIHPNGRRYQWEADFGPHECGPRALPSMLQALLKGHNQAFSVNLAGPADSDAVEAACEAVEAILNRQGLLHGGRKEWGNGRKWILNECPFAPEVAPHVPDRGSFVAVLPDARITAGCHHNRCRARLRDLHVSGWCFILRKGCISGY